MTARAVLTQSALDRAAKAAKAQGVTVTITAADGTVYQIAPALDARPETVQPVGQFDAWKAKRDAKVARRS